MIKIKKFIKLYLARWAVKFLCKEEGHNWIEQGGRACPYSDSDYASNCSQIVFRCMRCDTSDYGQKGGPSWDSCRGCDLRKEREQQH